MNEGQVRLTELNPQAFLRLPYKCMYQAKCTKFEDVKGFLEVLTYNLLPV